MKQTLRLAIAVLFVASGPGALAQQTATLTGTVVDATGARIPGAEVTATNTATGVSTRRASGDAGSYTIPGIQPGPYQIVASLAGFSDAAVQVNLIPNQTFRFNFTMQVGAVATAVEVVTDAGAMLATTGASLGGVLPEEEVLALPLATRDVFDLLKTTSGVVRAEGNDGGVNFAGGRMSSVNTTRDGIPVSDGRYLDWNGAYSVTYSSPDLVEEIQISISTVDPAAGRGSAQVRLQTRSGTNDFHGALFFSTNNSVLNANTWFDNLNGRDKDWENRNQYGGRLGGPLISDKAFFFVLIDNQEYRTRENVTSTVLTSEARRGLFRYFPGVDNDNFGAPEGQRSVDVLGNPLDWTEISGATGPMEALDLFSDISDPNRGSGISTNPYIQETLGRMPIPNNFRTGDGLNSAGFDWVRRVSGDDNLSGTSRDTNRKQLNLRLDYQITPANKVNWVMSRERNTNDYSLPAWPGGTTGKSLRSPRIYTAQYTSSLTPRVLNEFRFGYRETNWHGRPAVTEGCCFGNDGFVDLTPGAQNLFETFYSFSNGYPYLPDFNSFDSDPWLGEAGRVRSQNSPLYNFSDTVSWIVGSHAFTAGWEGNWADSEAWNGGGVWPTVSLGDGAFPLDLQTQVPDLDRNAFLAEAMLNDLSGSVSSWSHEYVVNDPSRGYDDIRATPWRIQDFHQNDQAVYFKDDWTVTPNLTFSYGVRWDVYGVPYEAKGLNTTARDFNFLGISGAAGELTEVVPVGKNSPNPGIDLYEKDWNNLAPSFGFSHRVGWLERTTVVRGGYGISYSGAPTFLQYELGPARNPGRIADGSVANPESYTALPGSTNPDAALVTFPVPPSPAVPYGTIQLTDSCRASGGCQLSVYAQDRRIPYIQNMNLSIETEIARNTNLSVAWIATSGVSLWGGRQLNEPSILASAIGETFLDAFNTTREGGDSVLFDDMFRGLRLGGQTIGSGPGEVSASTALRDWSFTDNYFADGEIGRLAEFISETNRGGGGYGGMLRANGYPENFLKPNPQFNQVDYYDNGDHSTYHSLEAQLTRRLSDALSGQFTYTWARALGNSGTDVRRGFQDESFGTRDPNNRNLQKGRLGFHRTHAFIAYGVWELPFGPGRLIGSGAPGWAARVIEGWQLSSIFSWTSGVPLSVITSKETLAAEDRLSTPDLVGGTAAFPKSLGEVHVGDGVVTYLEGFTLEREPTLDYYGANPDALERHDGLFQLVDAAGNVVLRNPKPGTTGNLALNWLEGPGRLGLDVALSKSLQMSEGSVFTIRVDAIDVLNTPRWNRPVLNINFGTFGRFTSASGARTFTLNARIDF